MKGFLYQFPNNIARIFSGYNLLWHIGAFILTYFLVVSDFDWKYLLYTRNNILLLFFFPAVILGAFIPLFGTLIFYAVSKKIKNVKATLTAYSLGQAALLGLLISSFYKAITGRLNPPEIFHTDISVDTSQIFHFGFLREGVFWGWPSSHTTIAFAMAITLIMLFPKNKIIRRVVILYAFYIGLGVSMTIHWFSDFAAGALIGTAIGIAVGKSFRKKRNMLL